MGTGALLLLIGLVIQPLTAENFGLLLMAVTTPIIAVAAIWSWILHQKNRTR